MCHAKKLGVNHYYKCFHGPNPIYALSKIIDVSLYLIGVDEHNQRVNILVMPDW